VRQEQSDHKVALARFPGGFAIKVHANSIERMKNSEDWVVGGGRVRPLVVRFQRRDRRRC
jgi:hypothetical protein